MTGFVRTIIQLVIAWLIATPLGDHVLAGLHLFGWTQDQLVGALVVPVLGVITVGIKLLEATSWGSKIVRWFNLAISLGQSPSGPTYEPRHLAPGA